MRYLLDSNILLRLMQPSDPLYADVCRAIRKLRREDAELVVVLQNLAEFWNVSTRPLTARGGYGQSVEETNRQLRSLLRRFALLEDVPGITRRWHRLLLRHSVQGVQVYDARLVAAMQAHGVSHLLTLDASDFARYTGITAVHPTSV
jgi:predicted nucleic acid-binding protein